MQFPDPRLPLEMDDAAIRRLYAPETGQPRRIDEPAVGGVVEASCGDPALGRCRWHRDRMGWVTTDPKFAVRVSQFKYLVDPVLLCRSA